MDMENEIKELKNRIGFVSIMEKKYDDIIREQQRLSLIMGNYQMEKTLRDSVDIMVDELEKVRKENKHLKRIMIKIGTKLFEKATNLPKVDEK